MSTETKPQERDNTMNEIGVIPKTVTTWVHPERREALRAFFVLMEAGMAKHDADRGPAGWREAANISDLLQWLDWELAELRGAIKTNADPATVASEAADLANQAMMIADFVGGLKAK